MCVFEKDCNFFSPKKDLTYISLFFVVHTIFGTWLLLRSSSSLWKRTCLRIFQQREGEEEEEEIPEKKSSSYPPYPPPSSPPPPPQKKIKTAGHNFSPSSLFPDHTCCCHNFLIFWGEGRGGPQFRNIKRFHNVW